MSLPRAPSRCFGLVRRLRLVRKDVGFDGRAGGADQRLGGTLQNGAPAGFELASLVVNWGRFLFVFFDFSLFRFEEIVDRAGVRSDVFGTGPNRRFGHGIELPEHVQLSEAGIDEPDQGRFLLTESLGYLCIEGHAAGHQEIDGADQLGCHPGVLGFAHVG